MYPARVTQSRHYRIMLAVVAGQTDNRHSYARLVEQGVTHCKAVIGAAVIDEHDLVSARDREILERANQIGDAGRAVVDRNHDRQCEAMRQDLKGLSQERSPPW